MAPEPGFEPGTVALTARCSTVELLRNGRFSISTDSRDGERQPSFGSINHGSIHTRVPPDPLAHRYACAYPPGEVGSGMPDSPSPSPSCVEAVDNPQIAKRP